MFSPRDETRTALGSVADTNGGVDKPCIKEGWKISEGLMHFRMISDEFWFGIVEGDIVAFFYRLDVTVTKCMLTMKFWKMMDVEFAEDD